MARNIAHIKNSKNRFHKTKKRGRIGKDCIYFNNEKLICNNTNNFCNSKNCIHFKPIKLDSGTLSEYNENYISLPQQAGTHEKTNEYLHLSKNIGTPVHVHYLKSSDPRRHKAHCIYYRKDNKHCEYIFSKCRGSSHCLHYKEK